MKDDKVLLQILSKRNGVVLLGYADTKQPIIRLHTKGGWDSIPVGQCAFIPLSYIPKPKWSEVGDIIDKYVNTTI